MGSGNSRDHKAWCLHKPSECKLKDKKPAAKVEANTADIEPADSNEGPEDDSEDGDDTGSVLASYAAALGGAAGN
jgi:hypothetical protein